MVTGGVSENTFGPGLGIKRRRRREQMEEEDSSDLSDESEDEDARAAQQIKFAKMPIRLRSGSSPGRKEEPKIPPNLSSPIRKPGARRGSHSTVEAIKQRARRDTATSSEMSSDNDFDNSAFKARQSRNTVGEEDDGLHPVARQQSDLLPEEMEDDSLGSYMSSGFAASMDSQNMIDSVRLPQVDQQHHVGTIPSNLAKKPPQSKSPRKSMPAPPAQPSPLAALPPSRPISYIKPVSLLSQMINARRAKPSLPFEKFAPFTGRGDPNPINLRIWAPISKDDPPYFEVLIKRIINDPEQGNREATISDLIGLALWRYGEENKVPKLTAQQLNVNRWNLRLMDDDEVEMDFPPLDRTKNVIGLAPNNNSGGGGRGGRRGARKTFDEFGLVEASDAEFEQNCQKTPQYTQESEAAPAGGADDDFPAAAPRKSSVNKQDAPTGGIGANLRNLNPLLTTMQKSGMQADLPPKIARDTTARPGVTKLLRIHIMSSDAVPGQVHMTEVNTGSYLAEVLDQVCKKRGLDKAAHVLKLRGSGAVVLLDRTVGSIGQATDLELWRRRFGTDGPLGMAGSPSSHSPKMPIGSLDASGLPDRAKKSRKMAGFMGSSSLLNLPSMHPLAKSHKLDEPGSTAANYQKWSVWRKQPMRFVGMNERVVAIDGEYLHILPGSTGRKTDEGGKEITVHFSNVVGCKQLRRHPSNFKVSTLTQGGCEMMRKRC